MGPGDFEAFFGEVYGQSPFPWQKRLLRIVHEEGRWPSTLGLPTGAGKTAAMDIAVFHLALEADRGTDRRAPVRVAFVVDRRLVVDDAFHRATKLQIALTNPTGPITRNVADRLASLAGDGPPLIARRLRGGIPREDDWARTPSQPTILCSTVDQVGSRLLFRGYGVSDSMKPVHAGLLGSDCLILLDEAHLAEPFRQTLEWVGIYRGQDWRESSETTPWRAALLTATPGLKVEPEFTLSDEDKADPILSRRLNAPKPARLERMGNTRKEVEGTESDEDADFEKGEKDVDQRVAALVGHVHKALKHFANNANGAPKPAIAVIVNRVIRARAVFKRLKDDFAVEIRAGTIAEPVLMIGPARPIDRDKLTHHLTDIRTLTWNAGEHRALLRPLVIVATQCIEAGVDIDLDALITEIASLDALQQRFGRLNRAGRDVVPYAAIVAPRSDLSLRHVDPVYGTSLKPTWEALEEARADDGAVDFGIKRCVIRMSIEALAPKPDAPILLPAHLDLLSQTSPVPAADPDLSLFLHGPDRQPDSVTVVWRADIEPDRRSNSETRRLLTLFPPRSTEAVELPVWAVRRWLLESGNVEDLADTATTASAEERPRARRRMKHAFLWKGDDDRSKWIDEARDIRPGDTIVVSAGYGGIDRFGWNPNSQAGAQAAIGDAAEFLIDVAQEAVEPFAGRRFAVRVGPGLVGDRVTVDALADALAASPSRRWLDLRDAVLALPLPESLKGNLTLLDSARRGQVVSYTDAYGHDDEGRPRGVIFIGLKGIVHKPAVSNGTGNSTEDDTVGSIAGFSVKLGEHGEHVASTAGGFARRAGLPPNRCRDLEYAGRGHDLGKSDPRFQAWLYYGDPLGPDEGEMLAKSGRQLPPVARTRSGLPERWRHEAHSVRIARKEAKLVQADDPELVLWLIGTHHGYGRPLFPHCDPMESVPDVGPQSFAFDWNGCDWPSLFERLKARYGAWELARMEAILRLADHRASEDEGKAE